MGDASRKMRPLTRALHVVLAGCAAHLSAATITVNTTADTVAVDGGCTLREAIANANASSDTTGGDCVAGTGTDTIDFLFPPGTTLPPVISVGSTLSLVSSSVTVDGYANTINGQSPVALDGGGNNGSLLSISKPNGAPFAMVNLYGLTIRNGHSNTGGAGIYVTNNVLLHISQCTLSGNTASAGGGGITAVNAALIISDSTIGANVADTGGGILSEGSFPFLPSLGNELSRSTVSGNSARLGGGIYISGDANWSISHSTISGNSASSAGGAVVSVESGTYSSAIDNSTLSANSAPLGAGMYLASGQWNVTRSTIAGNNFGGALAIALAANTSATTQHTIISDSSGTSCVTGGGMVLPVDSGGNIDNGTSCGFSAANGSYPSTDPKLGPLADNGGPTQTMRLLAGSPALDKYGCVGSGGDDQRGVLRPQGSKCDIGAFELEDKIFANGFE